MDAKGTGEPGVDPRPPGALHGWLAFFLVTLSAITPLLALWITYRHLYANPDLPDYYGDGWPMLQAIAWTATALTVGGSWLLAWRMNTIRRWSTVRFTLIALWVLMFVPTALEIVGISVLTGAPMARLAGASVAMFVRGGLYAAIWTAYLLGSAYVASVYLRNTPADLERVFD